MPLSSPRPPMGAAVNNSSLFSLPPEIRLMIYKYVMPSEAYVIINHYHSRGKDNCVCRRCKHVFRTPRDLDSHNQRMARLGWHNSSDVGLSFFSSILRTCRIIHAEACSWLYQSTLFLLEDPISAKRFSMHADQDQVRSLRMAFLVIGSWKQYLSWLSYFDTGFSKDFPKLRLICICFLRDKQRFIKILELLITLIRSFNWLEVIELTARNVERSLDACQAAFEELKDTKRLINTSSSIKIGEGSTFAPYPGWKRITFSFPAASKTNAPTLKDK